MKDVTNGQVAELLGVSQSMVSRLRSGHRMPSMTTMQRIEKVFRWRMSYQAKAFNTSDYAVKFEYAINRHFQLMRDADEAAAS